MEYTTSGWPLRLRMGRSCPGANAHTLGAWYSSASAAAWSTPFYLVYRGMV